MRFGFQLLFPFLFGVATFAQNYLEVVSDPDQGSAAWVGMIRVQSSSGTWVGSGSVAFSNQTGLAAAHNFYDDDGFYVGGEIHYLPNYHSNDYAYTLPSNAAAITHHVLITGDRGYTELLRAFGDTSSQAFSADIAMFATSSDLINRFRNLPEISLEGIPLLQSENRKQIVGYAVGMYPWAPPNVSSTQPTFKIHESPIDREVFYSLTEDYPEFMVSEEFSETTAFVVTAGTSGSPLFVEENGEWKTAAVVNSGVSDLVFQTVDGQDYTAGYVGVRAMGADMLDAFIDSVFAVDVVAFTDSNSRLDIGEITFDIEGLGFVQDIRDVVVRTSGDSNYSNSSRVASEDLVISDTSITVRGIEDVGTHYFWFEFEYQGLEWTTSARNVTISSRTLWSHFVASEQYRIAIYDRRLVYWSSEPNGDSGDFDLLDFGISSAIGAAIYGNDLYILDSGPSSAVHRIPIQSVVLSSEVEAVVSADRFYIQENILMYEEGEGIGAIDLDTQQQITLDISAGSIIGNAQALGKFVVSAGDSFGIRFGEDLNTVELDLLSQDEQDYSLYYNAGNDHDFLSFSGIPVRDGFYFSKPDSFISGTHFIQFHSPTGATIETLEFDSSLPLEDAAYFYDEESRMLNAYVPSWVDSGMEKLSFSLNELGSFHIAQKPLGFPVDREDITLLALYDHGALYFDESASEVKYLNGSNLSFIGIARSDEMPIFIPGSNGSSDRVITTVRVHDESSNIFENRICFLGYSDGVISVTSTIDVASEFPNTEVTSEFLGETKDGLYLSSAQGIAFIRETNGTYARDYYLTRDVSDFRSDVEWVGDSPDGSYFLRHQSDEVSVYESEVPFSEQTSLDEGTTTMALDSFDSSELQVYAIEIADWLVVAQSRANEFFVFDLSSDLSYRFEYSTVLTEVGAKQSNTYENGVKYARAISGSIIRVYFKVANSNGDQALMSVDFDTAGSEFSNTLVLFHDGFDDSDILGGAALPIPEAIQSEQFDNLIDDLAYLVDLSPEDLSLYGLNARVFQQSFSDIALPFYDEISEGPNESFLTHSILGEVYSALYPWLYTESHGWIHFSKFDLGELESARGVWFTIPDLGAVYTSEAQFPYVYRAEGEDWVYLHVDSSGHAWMYDFALQSWQSWTPALSGSE